MGVAQLERLAGGALLTTVNTTLPGTVTVSRLVVPATTAAVTATDPTSGTPVNVYADATLSGTPLVQPLQPDSDGRLPGFVQQPALINLNITGTGLIPRVLMVGEEGPPVLLDVSKAPYHVKGDCTVVTDGAMTAGGGTPTRLTTAAAASMKVGQVVYVRGAGAAGVTLQTKVTALVDATHVTLADPATTTVAAAAVVYGTDNHDAVVSAIATGRSLWFPNATGKYLLDCHNDGSGYVQPATAGYLKIVGESREGVTLRLGPEGVNIDSVLFGLGNGHQLTVQDCTLEGQDFLGHGGPSLDPGSPTGTVRNYGISHGGNSGIIRLINARIRRFVFDCGVNATSSTVEIDAHFTHFEGYGSTYRSLPLGAGESVPSAWVGNKRVRAHHCRFSDFGDPTSGGNFYHAVYVSTAWALDLEGSYFHHASPTSTGWTVQHFDQVITPANAAPVSRLVACDFGPDLAGMGGALTSYNAETEILGGTYDNLEGTSIGVAGAAVIDDVTFISPADFGGRTIATAAQGQATGLTWGAQITNCRWRGATGVNGPNAIAILNSSATSDFKVDGCTFAGFTGGSSGYILIFGSGSVVGGTIDVAGCWFRDNPGYNIQAANMSTGMRMTVRSNHFYTADGTKCVKTAGTALAYLGVKGNEFAQVTAADAFSLGIAPTALDIGIDNFGYKTANGGTTSPTPGAVTTVNIAHGLGNSGRTITPTKISIVPGNSNARVAWANMTVTADATNVILTFTAALTAAQVYTWSWRAEA